MRPRCFLFDTTASQMLYTSLCGLCTLQRQRRRAGEEARDDFGFAHPYELALRR